MIAVDDEFVWLHLAETGGTAQFAAGSVASWTARGWVPCDPPTEADPTRAHAAEADAAPATDSAPEVDADPKSKKSGGAGTTMKGAESVG